MSDATCWVSRGLLDSVAVVVAVMVVEVVVAVEDERNVYDICGALPHITDAAKSAVVLAGINARSNSVTASMSDHAVGAADVFPACGPTRRHGPGRPAATPQSCR